MASVRTVTGETYHLARWEQETIINYNEEDKTADVTTWRPSLIRKLDALAEQYPDECKAIKKPNSAPQYIVPKKWIVVRKPRTVTMTEERKAHMAEMLKVAREKK